MRAAWQAMQSRVFPVNRSWNSGGLHLHGFKEIPGGESYHACGTDFGGGQPRNCGCSFSRKYFI